MLPYQIAFPAKLVVGERMVIWGKYMKKREHIKQKEAKYCPIYTSLSWHNL